MGEGQNLKLHLTHHTYWLHVIAMCIVPGLNALLKEFFKHYTRHHGVSRQYIPVFPSPRNLFWSLMRKQSCSNLGSSIRTWFYFFHTIATISHILRSGPKDFDLFGSSSGQTIQCRNLYTGCEKHQRYPTILIFASTRSRRICTKTGYESLILCLLHRTGKRFPDE